MAKGPESAEQCRLHSLGIQRDRELSMSSHARKKTERSQYKGLQRNTKGKGTCQSIAQQLPGINMFKTRCHQNSKENLLQIHRRSITFGHLLASWTSLEGVWQQGETKSSSTVPPCNAKVSHSFPEEPQKKARRDPKTPEGITIFNEK